jgi:hypothetical protein
MNRNIGTAIEDAEWHLKMGKKVKEEQGPNRIAIGYFIHSMIRATDALCWHYTGNRCNSGSGHDLHLEFEKLYTKYDLPEKYSKYKENIRKWVKTEKTNAEYKGENFSSSEYTRARKSAERYLNKCVKNILED